MRRRPTKIAFVDWVIARAREDGSIGAMERLAGIAQDCKSRRAFWAPFRPLADISTQAYIDAAMAECRKRIKQQIEHHP
jgi:hypothetical protein